jgi:hypothetical protein
MRFFWRFFFSFQECLSACTSIAYKGALVDDQATRGQATWMSIAFCHSDSRCR